MRLLIACLFLCFSVSASAREDRKKATKEQRRAVKAANLEMRQAVYRLDVFAVKADTAIARLVKHTYDELVARGHKKEADQLFSEYRANYTHAVVEMYSGVSPERLGDFKPLDQWLADWYDVVEFLLGEELCKFLHIIDLKIYNYGLPVVFHPRGYLGETWTLRDYQDHFGGETSGLVFFDYHGVAGVTAYWVSYAACEAATWGTGTVFLCGFLGGGVEWGFDKWVSPSAAEFVYCSFNPEQNDCRM